MVKIAKTLGGLAQKLGQERDRNKGATLLIDANKSNLRYLASELRKGEALNVAFGMFGDTGLALMQVSRQKAPTGLHAELKRASDNKLRQHGLGTISVDAKQPKVLVVGVTEGKASNGMARHLATAVKGTGFNKVRLQWPDGTSDLDGDEDEDAVGTDAHDGGAESDEAEEEPRSSSSGEGSSSGTSAPVRAPLSQAGLAASSRRIGELLGTLPLDDATKADLRKRLATADAAVASGALQGAHDILLDIGRALRDGHKPSREQLDTYGFMSTAMERVNRTYFTAGATKGLADELPTLKAGSEFTAYARAVADFSADRSPANAAEVERTAKAYLAHNKGLNPFAAGTKESKRKKQLCETGLVAARQLQQAAAFQNLGPPPWSETTAIKMASLRAAFSFETGYKKAEQLENESGISQSFWVKGFQAREGGEVRLDRDFIFKPAAGERSVSGFPAGGSTPREAVSRRVADNVLQMTGIDLGVPETNIATVDRDMLAVVGGDDAFGAAIGETGSAGPTLPSGKMVGSIQAFRTSGGPLGRHPGRKAIVAGMPQAECEKLAVLDMLTLNLDRHSGNIMVAEDGQSFIPIDHGLTFPSLASFRSRAPERLGTAANVGLSCPRSYEPFSADMRTKLGRLDPGALRQGMEDSIGALDTAFPDTQAATMIPAENRRMAQRTARFLKAACTQLSPAEAQLAIAHFGDRLFTADPANVDAAIAELINIFAGQSDRNAVKVLICDLREKAGDVFKVLQSGKWHRFPEAGRTYQRWLLQHASTLLAAYLNKTSRPQTATVPVGLLPPTS